MVGSLHYHLNQDGEGDLWRKDNFSFCQSIEFLPAHPPVAAAVVVPSLLAEQLPQALPLEAW